MVAFDLLNFGCVYSPKARSQANRGRTTRRSPVLDRPSTRNTSGICSCAPVAYHPVVISFTLPLSRYSGRPSIRLPAGRFPNQAMSLFRSLVVPPHLALIWLGV